MKKLLIIIILGTIALWTSFGIAQTCEEDCMQWLIDLIVERVKAEIPDPETVFDQLMEGTILLWSGNNADVPDGWAICNGDNGTPDLRDRFIPCAVGQVGEDPVIAYPPGGVPFFHQTGGTMSHTHGSSTGLKTIELDDGDKIAAGDTYEHRGKSHLHTIASDYHFPRFYALWYIMKLPAE